MDEEEKTHASNLRRYNCNVSLTSEEAAARITYGNYESHSNKSWSSRHGPVPDSPLCTRGSLIHMTTPSLADRVPSVASCGTSEQRKVDVREPEVHLTTKIDISAHLIR
jgi:hypothetical protein